MDTNISEIFLKEVIIENHKESSLLLRSSMLHQVSDNGAVYGDRKFALIKIVLIVMLKTQSYEVIILAMKRSPDHIFNANLKSQISLEEFSGNHRGSHCLCRVNP